MFKFTRLDAPKCLTENDNYKVWGKNYAKTKHSWHWHTYKGTEVDKLIRSDLLIQTQNHCSFCDAYRIPSPIAHTIEHFRPKSIFPLLAYTWQNLFISCHNCQKIIADFDLSRENLRQLLKPDSEDYHFQKYFYFDSETGKIEIKKGNLTEKEIERAELTQKYYQLNDKELIKARLEILDDYEHYLKKDCSKRPYRYMFEDCKEIKE
jgi:uncharacterized protein (TIGR02646 family)